MTWRASTPWLTHSLLHPFLMHVFDIQKMLPWPISPPLVNTRGPLFVHPSGIVKRTHFHTMAMYSNLLEDHMAEVESISGKLIHDNDSVGVVDAIATVDEKGSNWAISLVNRHPSDHVDCTVKMGDKLLNGTFRATVLTGDSPDSFNDIEHPQRVSPAEVEVNFKKGIAHLPPHSLTIVHVDWQ
jgi:alpha-N-arabinofuranosidase